MFWFFMCKMMKRIENVATNLVRSIGGLPSGAVATVIAALGGGCFDVLFLCKFALFINGGYTSSRWSQAGTPPFLVYEQRSDI
uniref:MATE efflux family protein n=1 Tax=Angiostrongylus cantonensis TaxID=6313 RepID=A0A0K0DB99_ANGCA